MVLLLDNFDSFTYNLADYLAQLGAETRVIRNNVPLDVITQDNYDGLVISPGPETPSKAGNLMEVLDHYLGLVPVLGICLGHQAIGEYFGAELIKAERPMHGKISSVNLTKDDIFKGLPPRIDVVRYNSLILKSTVNELHCLAMTDANEIMALKHKKIPVWGLQFHPEAALTEHGLGILKNWLYSNGIIT